LLFTAENAETAEEEVENYFLCVLCGLRGETRD